MTTPVDRVWQAVDAQRASLTALLDDLSDDEWRQPSLCAGWTVRDVAAHLTLQELGLVDVLRLLRSWRGSMDLTNAHAARVRAAELTTAQIVAGIRATIGSRRHNVGMSRLETLTDILVHGQDIAIPLGRRLDTAPDAAAAALDRNLSMRVPPPPRSVRIAKGYRLVATDTTWSGGGARTSAARSPHCSSPSAGASWCCRSSRATGRRPHRRPLGDRAGDALGGRAVTAPAYLCRHAEFHPSPART